MVKKKEKKKEKEKEEMFTFLPPDTKCRALRCGVQFLVLLSGALHPFGELLVEKSRQPAAAKRLETRSVNMDLDSGGIVAVTATPRGLRILIIE